MNSKELINRLSLFSDTPIVVIDAKGHLLPVIDVGIHVEARVIMIVVNHTEEETIKGFSDEPRS